MTHTVDISTGALGYMMLAYNLTSFSRYSNLLAVLAEPCCNTSKNIQAVVIFTLRTQVIRMRFYAQEIPCTQIGLQMLTFSTLWIII